MISPRMDTHGALPASTSTVDEEREKAGGAGSQNGLLGSVPGRQASGAGVGQATAAEPGAPSQRPADSRASASTCEGYPESSGALPGDRSGGSSPSRSESPTAASRLSVFLDWLECGLTPNAAKALLLAGSAGFSWLGSPEQAWLSSACLYASLSLSVPPATKDFLSALADRNVDAHVLMALAALGSLASGHAGEGALLLLLFQASHAAEHALSQRARGSLAALLSRLPRLATRVEVDPGSGRPLLGSAAALSAADLEVGDHVLVRPGEQAPVDGQVVHGASLVGSEHLTGESLPSAADVGSFVPGGALAHDGALTLRVLRRADESTPARVVRMALEAQARKPALQTFVDRLVGGYAKAVLGASALAVAGMVLAGVPLIGGGVGMTEALPSLASAMSGLSEAAVPAAPHAPPGALYRAMCFLTVASPCALVLAPMGYVAAIAAAASRGVLFRGGATLDAVASCRVVAFDKTGTLTAGELVASAPHLLAAEGAASTQLSLEDPGLGLAVAAALSRRSSHPASAAIVRRASEAQAVGSAPDLHVEDFKLIPGAGVQGAVAWAGAEKKGSVQDASLVEATLGSASFVSGLLRESERAALEAWLAGVDSAASVLLLCASGARAVWAVELADRVHESSARAVWQLQTGAWAEEGAAEDMERARGGAGFREAGGAAGEVRVGSRGEAGAGSRGEAGAGSRGEAGAGSRGEAEAGSSGVLESNAPRSPNSSPPQLAHHPSNVYACQVLMLTGDRRPPALAVARALGLTQGAVHAGLTPEDKLRIVLGRQEGGEPVMMVGDGLNDAAALAAAHVGVAVEKSAAREGGDGFGYGEEEGGLGGPRAPSSCSQTHASAAALAADLVLVGGRGGVDSLPYALRLASHTRRVVLQNVGLAAGTIALLAAPTLAGELPLWAAVALHEGSTLLVALNSLRLLQWGWGGRRR